MEVNNQLRRGACDGFVHLEVVLSVERCTLMRFRLLVSCEFVGSKKMECSSE